MKYDRIITTALLSAAVLTARADVLELKNGQVLTGKYAGGTAGTIRFQPSGGLQVIPVGQALALTFSGADTTATAPAAAPTSTFAPAPAPAAPVTTVVAVPAGSTLLVRMVDPVSSRDRQGKRFTAMLETDLVANGTIVAKAGTKVYGRVQSAQQARRFVGQSKLDLRLSELAVGGSLVPIMTGPYAAAGARSTGKTAKGAAAGAAIGAMAGDAGKGAAIGAMASGLKKGDTISVAPGTLLEFQLQQAVNLSVTR